MRVKRSTLAGSWYPADPDELRQEVDGWLDESDGGEIEPLAVVVPHAGYRYSGPIAAAAYRRLRGFGVRRAVILAPSHVAAFAGMVVPDFDQFETPLGRVAVDPVTRGLAGRRRVRLDDGPFADEHSLEIQLPFLQRVAPGVRVVPLLFGHVAGSGFRDAAAVIEDLAGDDTVFAISSDFTHYGWRFGYEPFPATDAESVRRGLREIDMGAVDRVISGDAEGFAAYIESTGATVCGRVPLMAFLTWAGSGRRGELAGYRTSLDVTGDHRHVVSYAAVAFTRS